MTFNTKIFDLATAKAELNNFKTLLTSKTELDEKVDILPFFKSNPQLSSLIATYCVMSHKKLVYQYEMPLYGQMQPDLVVGDDKGKFVFIEFEDGKTYSIFKGKKKQREFATRFNGGLSQIIDWFWRIQNMSPTDLDNDFGHYSNFDFEGIVIIGRDLSITGKNEANRLSWRSSNVVVNSKKILFKTYDQLYNDLSDFIDGVS